MDKTLSVYIIGIKGSSYYTIAQFSSEFHTRVQFSLKAELFEGDMMKSREEVFTYIASCVCVVLSHEDRHKNGCVGDQRERSEVMHYD